MLPRAYYLTTFGEWQRHAPRFARSHWIALRVPAANEDCPPESSELPPLDDCVAGLNSTVPQDNHAIIAIIEADEGVHNSLEQDPAWEALPHPLSLKPVSENAQAALAGQGIAPGATTFDVAEAVAAAHPLLRHRVF